MKNMWKAISMIGMLVILCGISAMTATAAHQQAQPLYNTLEIEKGCGHVEGYARLPFEDMKKIVDDSYTFDANVDYSVSNDLGVASCFGKTDLSQESNEILITHTSQGSASVSRPLKSGSYGGAMSGTILYIKAISVQSTVRLKLELTYSMVVNSVGICWSSGHINFRFSNPQTGTQPISFIRDLMVTSTGQKTDANTVSYIVDVPSGSVSMIGIIDCGGSSVQHYSSRDPSASPLVNGYGDGSTLISLKISIL